MLLRCFISEKKKNLLIPLQKNLISTSIKYHLIRALSIAYNTFVPVLPRFSSNALPGFVIYKLLDALDRVSFISRFHLLRIRGIVT